MTDAAELYGPMPACRRLGAGRAEGEQLDAVIRRNLEELGYGE